MRYVLTIEEAVGVKEYTNLDDFFKSLRKIIKNHNFKESSLKLMIGKRE